MPTPRFLTPADVAEVLNVSVRQVYALLQREEIEALKIGGKGTWRVSEAALEDYIRRATHGGARDRHAAGVTQDSDTRA